MTFIHTVPEEEATGKLREIYGKYRQNLGYVPNYTKALSLRPEFMEAWGNLLGAMCRNMRLRPYELVAIAAASTMKCTY